MNMFNKNKNKNGLTLIETLVVITIGLAVALSVFLFINNFNNKLQDKETASTFVKIASAMDTRFAVDGYSVNNFSKREWNNNDETNDFINSFNGKNSTCSSIYGWVPNTNDSALKEKYIKQKTIPCDVFKIKSPLESKMKSKLIVNNINSQILISFVYFYYDTNKKMQDNFPRWKNIINESYNKDTLNNASKHVYALMDRTKDEFITETKCVEIGKDCSLVVGVVSDEASSLIHLSTIGENKQVGKISFSKGILNPQVCQKWDFDGTNWNMSNTICGIENNNEKIGFKLGDINSNFVMLDKICTLKELDIDKYVNVTDVSGVKMPVNAGTIPCGVSSSLSGSNFIVTTIVDDIKTKRLFVKELSTQHFNANVLTVSNLSIDEELKVYGSTNILNKLTVKSAMEGDELETETLISSNARINNPFELKNLIVTQNLFDANVVAANNASSPEMYTNYLTATNLITYDFVSKGDFTIGGNINTKDFKETGVLSADTINFSKPALISASGAMGGYAEIDGQTNSEKIGVSSKSILTENYFLALSTPTGSWMLDVKDSSGNTTFGVSTHGSMYLKNGLRLPSPDHPNDTSYDRFNVNANGDVIARVNFFETSGCCVDAPFQFYGPVGILGSFTIQSNPRFVDVEDIGTNTSGLTLDPDFVLPRAGYTFNDQKKNTLVMNRFRLNSYAAAINKFESTYNTTYNAINTPGLKGNTGQKGDMGIQGDQGDKGEQGETGSQGPTGPLYNANTAIWLPKEVICATSNTDIDSKYGSSKNTGAWPYFDVIEGTCGNTNIGKVKYFERTTPIDNICSSSQKEYDIYECKEAKYRKEPYAYNYAVKGNFCLGDSSENSNPSDGIINSDNNTICYTDTNRNHRDAGRAYNSGFFGYYANGTNDYLGNRSTETSIISNIGENKWTKVLTCGGSTRPSEDLLGLSMEEYLIDDKQEINANDIGTACSVNNQIKYRKVNYNGNYYGNPTDFEDYKDNGFKNVTAYLKNNVTACGRTQVYEISRCEKSYTDLTKLDYTTHPKGFPMPKKDDAPIDDGMTGKYAWMKGDKVCLDGNVSDYYPGVTDWYSSDRLYTACSVENSYRSEYLGVCGVNSDQSSYQMYRCRDEYYTPTVPDLAYRVSDIKCLNSQGNVFDPVTQEPLPIEKIDDYYPNIAVNGVNEVYAGQACSVERNQIATEEIGSQLCSQGYVRYTVYDCR